MVLAGCLAIVSGCQRAAPVEYVSSAEVKDLEPKMQEEVHKKLRAFSGTPSAPKLLGGTETEQAELKRGQQVYDRYCLPCHGVSGDGNGPAAAYLNPRPRDYRRGIFKFTSTSYGSKPRREDLIRTVTRGIPGTSMPSFARLPKHDLDAVVDYVLALSRRGELERLLVAQAIEEDLDDETAQQMADLVVRRWKDAPDNVVEPVTKMPPMTAQSIDEGAAIFQKRECHKCHGRNGRGGLAGGIEVGTDSWGHKAAAADLTSGMLHGGQRPLDVYRRIYAGINGTPMPAFKELFADKPDDIWHLTHYVLDLADKRREGVKFPPVTKRSPDAPAGEADKPAPAPEKAS